jgi:two-component system KDP operon response regulator KdpE
MNEPGPVALMVEDEPEVRRFVRSALEAEGWRVHEAVTMKRALVDAANRKPDLLIVDLGLPDGDGVDLVAQVRKWSSVPIIILSARANESDKIRGLDAGADDYLAKPFGIGELLARVRAAHRRQYRPATGTAIDFGNVRIDPEARTVSRDGQPVHLTSTEYRLLMTLVKDAGRVVTSAQLLREVWGPSHADNAHYVRIYMGHLRQKLEADSAQPRYILTEPGVGYRFLPEP